MTGFRTITTAEVDWCGTPIPAGSPLLVVSVVDGNGPTFATGFVLPSDGRSPVRVPLDAIPDGDSARRNVPTFTVRNGRTRKVSYP